MKFLSWNCRGFRASPTIRRLRRIIKQKNPTVVFLAESLCPVHVTKIFFSSAGLSNVTRVDSQGRSGGLVLAWSDLFACTILDLCPHWIHLSYCHEDGMLVYVTFVYGHPKKEFRYVVWNFLTNLAPMITGPWMILGDFKQAKCYPIFKWSSGVPVSY